MFFGIPNDTKSSLTAAVLQIVNYLKNESQLDTSKQNIVVNKITQFFNCINVSTS